jgi:hypothetical protein
MTNIIKNTLIEKRDQITAELEAALLTQKNMIVQRAKQLLDIPDHVEVKVQYGDSIYLYLENKEIFSIHNRTYGKPYLNTYSTMMEDTFEFERLVINGRIAEKFLYDKNMFEKLFASVDDELVDNITKLKNEMFQLEKEIRLIKQKEAEDVKQTALKNFFEGNEIKFEKMKTVQYGSRKHDYFNRVVGMRMVEANKSKKKVTVEFECPKYYSDETVKHVRDNIQMKYIEYYIK